jgi:hypothetical protein
MANRAARSNARARMATQGWRAKPNQTHASALTAEITATVTPLVAIAFATVVSPAPTAQRSSHAAAVSVVVALLIGRPSRAAVLAGTALTRATAVAPPRVLVHRDNNGSRGATPTT